MLHEVGAGAGAGDEEEGLNAGLGLVAFVHLLRDVFGIGGPAEGDGGATEAATSHSGPEDC